MDHADSLKENGVAMACHAMGTRFEMVLKGEDRQRLWTVGEEAIEEITRLESLLSFYKVSSELSGINLRAGHEAVAVSATMMRVLVKARHLYEMTGGAFDVTVAPLMRCWGFVGSSGRLPEHEEIEAARALVGMDQVELDEELGTVRFRKQGVLLDLGSIGKGYAIDQAAMILREAGVESALLHGGTSSVYGLGCPAGAGAWQVAIQRPYDPEPGSHLAIAELKERALSVSATHGKAFRYEGRNYGHVIDPRTGWPVDNGLLACLVTESAMDGDGLSTGLLTLGPAWLTTLQARLPDVDALIVTQGADDVQEVTTIGRFTSPKTSGP